MNPIESRRRRRNKPKGPAYTAPKVKAKPLPSKLQPRWKWSYNGNNDNLHVWPTDEYGDPHHSEMTGQEYYKFCQGRIYVYGDGDRETITPGEDVEIFVWSNRGPKQWQPAAVAKVKEWLKTNFDADVSKVIYRDDYDWWNQHGNFVDYFNDLKNSDEDYLADQYAEAVDRDGKDPDDAYADYNAPIDWDKVPRIKETMMWVWMYDSDFNARRTDDLNPTAEEYTDKFGDDGTWSAQGMVIVNGQTATLIIDDKKPYAFANSELDLKREQNDAKDAGIKWIKTILGLNVTNVKYL